MIFLNRLAVFVALLFGWVMITVIILNMGGIVAHELRFLLIRIKFISLLLYLDGTFLRLGWGFLEATAAWPFAFYGRVRWKCRFSSAQKVQRFWGADLVWAANDDGASSLCTSGGIINFIWSFLIEFTLRLVVAFEFLSSAARSRCPTTPLCVPHTLVSPIDCHATGYLAILVAEMKHRSIQHRVQVYPIERFENRFCFLIGLLLKVQRFNLLKFVFDLLTNSQERVRIGPIALFWNRSATWNTWNLVLEEGGEDRIFFALLIVAKIKVVILRHVLLVARDELIVKRDITFWRLSDYFFILLAILCQLALRFILMAVIDRLILLIWFRSFLNVLSGCLL